MFLITICCCIMMNDILSLLATFQGVFQVDDHVKIVSNKKYCGNSWISTTALRQCCFIQKIEKPLKARIEMPIIRKLFKKKRS